MDYKEFVSRMKDDIQQAFPGASITETHVDKLQGQSYDGITVTPEGGRMGVSLDLTPYFDLVDGGTDYADVLDHITGKLETEMSQMPEVSSERLRDYGSMKEHLVMQIVGQAGNEEMLSNVPHKEMEDMAVVYRFDMGESHMGSMSVLITNSMMGNYGITAEQLHQDALEAAPLNRPPVIKGMGEVLAEMMGMPAPDTPDFLYVATTPDKVQGAAVIAYPGFLDEAAQKLGGDFAVLPSSVHEVLLVPDDGKTDMSAFKQMVLQINSAEVLPEDRLTDNAYHYDSKNKVLETADRFEARKLEKESMNKGKEGRKSVLGDLDSLKKECAAKPRKEPQMKKSAEMSI